MFALWHLGEGASRLAGGDRGQQGALSQSLPSAERNPRWRRAGASRIFLSDPWRQCGVGGGFILAGTAEVTLWAGVGRDVRRSWQVSFAVGQTMRLLFAGSSLARHSVKPKFHARAVEEPRCLRSQQCIATSSFA